MGYTTEFNGSFQLDKPLTAKQVDKLNTFSRTRHDDDPTDAPGIWCQWVATADGAEIEWDGGEKFYAYKAWLTYIIEKFLTPWGRTLTGSIEWRGEDWGDTGTLVVEDGVLVG
jgi:hypothetical protein